MSFLVALIFQGIFRVLPNVIFWFDKAFIYGCPKCFLQFQSQKLHDLQKDGFPLNKSIG